MIGVVVWANAVREKAIIWCEDQATLAYLQGRDNLAQPQQAWPMPGDLVELEAEMQQNLRHARSVSLISEQCCPDLPRILAAAEPLPATPVPATPLPEGPQLRVISNSEIRVQPGPLAERDHSYCRRGAAG